MCSVAFARPRFDNLVGSAWIVSQQVSLHSCTRVWNVLNEYDTKLQKNKYSSVTNARRKACCNALDVRGRMNNRRGTTEHIILTTSCVIPATGDVPSPPQSCEISNIPISTSLCDAPRKRRLRARRLWLLWTSG